VISSRLGPSVLQRRHLLPYSILSLTCLQPMASPRLSTLYAIQASWTRWHSWLCQTKSTIGLETSLMGATIALSLLVKPLLLWYRARVLVLLHIYRCCGWFAATLYRKCNHKVCCRYLPDHTSCQLSHTRRQGLTCRVVGHQKQFTFELCLRSCSGLGKADQPAPPCCGIEKVEKLTILGIIVNSSLTATDHVSHLLDSSASLLHALRVLRSHGLPSQSLKDVFHATVIGKLIYCAPAWHGFCLASDYTRLDSFLHHAIKLGYYDTQSATVSDLFRDADDAFFRKILYNAAHLLHMYLPNRSQK